MIEDGAELVKDLDEAEFPITAAFWLFMPDSGVWRLVLQSPLVDELGPLKSYGRIREVLDRKPNRIQLQETKVAGKSDRVVSAIRSVIKTGPEIAGIRLTGNTLNGVYVDDAYIYRIA